MDDAGTPAPDFAVLRAVEILARIAEAQKKSVLPPPIDVPIVLFNEHIMFVIGKTRRPAVVAELGPGYAFPVKGWETYAMREGTTRCLLSALYRDDELVAVDYVVAPANRVPELRARALGEFRFVPGQITIGGDMLRLDDRFAAVAQGPDNRTYSHSFAARFPGGIAYVQGTGGRIGRLAMYAVGDEAPPS